MVHDRRRAELRPFPRTKQAQHEIGLLTGTKPLTDAEPGIESAKLFDDLTIEK